MSISSLNRLEINLSALQENFHGLQSGVGENVKIMCVVKSDAYGHGLTRTALALSAAGAKIFGVAEVDEGVALRKAGINREIIVLLGPTPENCDDIIQYDLTPVIYDLDILGILSKKSNKADKSVRVHVKVDVGMGRLGVMPEELIPICKKIESLPGVVLEGLLGHFPMAENSVSELTTDQLARFKKIADQLAEEITIRPIRHIANSAALVNFRTTHLDMVRPGITLYGCYPDVSEQNRTLVDLKPVMAFKSRVMQVKNVPEGYGISYGHIFVTKKPTKLAVLPVGYDDGYLRRLSSRAEVLIHGRRAPIRGRICMNACMADITDFPTSINVKAGDEVVIMGKQNNDEITADEIASWLDTISYEVLCQFGSSNHRVYI